jgi:hypothetical protein
MSTSASSTPFVLTQISLRFQFHFLLEKFRQSSGGFKGCGLYLLPEELTRNIRQIDYLFVAENEVLR